MNERQEIVYPIRILHILYGLDRGGIETIIMNVYRNIDRRRIQFDFAIVKNESCDYENEILKLGGRIYRMSPVKKYFAIKYCIQLSSLLKLGDYKIVHAHWNTISTIPLLVSKLNHIPIRISHSHIAKTTKGYKGVIKKILRLPLKKVANYFFSCGNDAAEYLYGANYFKYKNFNIVNNAIDVTRYSYNINVRLKFRKLLNISSDAFVIGHVGRLTCQKNQSFLLDILKSIKAIDPKVTLILIGEGEDKDKLQSKIVENDLKDNVILLGSVPNVCDYLQTFDFYVFPSLFEGLSLSIIEAQAAGLRCLASDSIDKKSKITNLVKFYSLNNDAQSWAKQVLNYKNYVRESMCTQLHDAGYDIKDVSLWLQDFYINQYNNI